MCNHTDTKLVGFDRIKRQVYCVCKTCKKDIILTDIAHARGY